jgi:hypothetical protein
MDTKSLYLNSKGQGVVEYILLFAIVAILTLQVFKSKVFQDFFASEGSFMTQMRSYYEYSYKHAVSPSDSEMKSGNSNELDSYTGRFFGPNGPYPKN